MSDTPNPLANPDGARRYEELMADIKATAEQALAIAVSQSVVGSSAVLDIEHGGTGASTKIFVDTLTNQFNIDGIKIFHSSCGFQQESDVVDSGDLAGMVRLISCTPQAQDIGPQMRFCGRNTDDNLSVFSFATIAGRKSNSTSGDFSGYLQFATTNKEMEIIERVRIDEEGNLGVGTTIPIKGQGNRVWINGGDVLLDNDFPGVSGADISGIGGPHSYKLKIDSTLGRMQGIASDISSGVEDIFLSINTSFNSDLTNISDNPSLGTAAIQLRSSSSHGEIGFWIGDSPLSKVGFIDSVGLTMVDNIHAGANITADGYVRAEGAVTAGGVNNIINGAGNTSAKGVTTGDNLLTGNLPDPNNNVSAPVGAIYQSDAPVDLGKTIYIKVSGSYTNTGWKPLAFVSDYIKGSRMNLDPFTPVIRYGVPGSPPVFTSSLYLEPKMVDSTTSNSYLLLEPGNWVFRGLMNIGHWPYNTSNQSNDIWGGPIFGIDSGGSGVSSGTPSYATGNISYSYVRELNGYGHAYCGNFGDEPDTGAHIPAWGFNIGAAQPGYFYFEGNVDIINTLNSNPTSFSMGWQVYQTDNNNNVGGLSNPPNVPPADPPGKPLAIQGGYLIAWRIG